MESISSSLQLMGRGWPFLWTRALLAALSVVARSLVAPLVSVGLIEPSRHQICIVVPAFVGLGALSEPSWH